MTIEQVIISKEDYYFMLGYTDAERAYKQDDMKDSMDGFLAEEDGVVEDVYSQLDPYMFASYIDKTTLVPSQYYDNYIEGVNVSMNNQLMKSYLKTKGVK